MDIKNEQITYFKDEDEQSMNIKRIELTQRVNELGVKRLKILKSKKMDKEEKEKELIRIDTKLNII